MDSKFIRSMAATSYQDWFRLFWKKMVSKVEQVERLVKEKMTDDRCQMTETKNLPGNSTSFNDHLSTDNLSTINLHCQAI